MDEIEAKLLEAAKLAQGNAYAKYSGFKVGAALWADNGKIYSGTNVENASYPEGQCAETSAIGAMITDGGRHIRSILVLGSVACPPCGGCRQRISEFSDADTIVYVADDNGIKHSYHNLELLPAAFRLEIKT